MVSSATIVAAVSGLMDGAGIAVGVGEGSGVDVGCCVGVGDRSVVCVGAFVISEVAGFSEGVLRHADKNNTLISKTRIIFLILFPCNLNRTAAIILKKI